MNYLLGSLQIASHLTLVAVGVGPKGGLIAECEGAWFRMLPTPAGMLIQRFAFDEILRGRIDSMEKHEDGTWTIWTPTEHEDG